MQRSSSDTGVVLRVRPYLEYDIITTVFTKSYGKKTFLARGVRRKKSRICGIMQPLTGVSFSFLPPRSQTGLSVMTQVEYAFPPPDFFEDLPLLAEVAEKISPEGDCCKAFFSLLQDVCQARKRKNLLPLFLVKTFSLLGYLPPYTHCAETGEKISGPCVWHANGQLYEAKATKKSGIPLDFSEVKILSFWQQQPFSIAEKVILSPKTREKFLRYFLRFLEEEHGISLKNILS